MKPIEAFLLGIGLLILSALLIAVPIYFLWNWLMPGIFGLPIISIYQAWGLSALTSLLLKPSTTVKND
jgi:hypothetical protein